MSPSVLRADCRTIPRFVHRRTYSNPNLQRLCAIAIDESPAYADFLHWALQAERRIKVWAASGAESGRSTGASPGRMGFPVPQLLCSALLMLGLFRITRSILLIAFKTVYDGLVYLRELVLRKSADTLH